MFRIELYTDASGEWRWRGLDGNHRIICDGSEGYVSRDGLERAVGNVVWEFRGPVQVICHQQHAAAKGLEATYATLKEYPRDDAKPKPQALGVAVADEVKAVDRS